MFQFTLAVLPLIASHAFCQGCWRIKYRLARLDSQRLYLSMASYAVFLSVTAFLIAVALLAAESYQSWLQWLAGLLQLDSRDTQNLHQLLLISSLILVVPLGPLAAVAVNRLEWALREWRRGKAASYFATCAAVESDDFDLILFRAWSTETPIALTLASGKYYVGQVLRAIDPNEDRKTLRILPLVSGYRGPDFRVILTTAYSGVREQFEAANGGEPSLFELAVVRSEIQTLSMFDFQAYEKFQVPSTILLDVK